MGVYFNPPEEIREVGRLLRAGTFAELMAQLTSDEALFGLYDRFDAPFMNAAWLSSEDEFLVFENQVADGRIGRMGYYALPRAVARDNGLTV